jgi:hypothetical protein
MKIRIILLPAFFLSVFVSCHRNHPVMPDLKSGAMLTDTSAGIPVAENIIQDIVIQNNDPNDAWAEECLKGMHNKVLVDMLFEMVYSGKAAAYDFETREQLTVKQLQKIEAKEGFNRDEIGKIQFMESWYLQPDKVTMTKKVSSIILGYETHDSEGNFRGYLPVFRMVLNGNP